MHYTKCIYILKHNFSRLPVGLVYNTWLILGKITAVHSFNFTQRLALSPYKGNTCMAQYYSRDRDPDQLSEPPCVLARATAQNGRRQTLYTHYCCPTEVTLTGQQLCALTYLWLNSYISCIFQSILIWSNGELR